MEKQIKYYKKILIAIASKSTCNRAFVGAIIVRDKIIISTGYNGAPRGINHCGEKHIMINSHCINTVHAEMNAILSAARSGTNIIDSDMYCTFKPCYNCMKSLINSGIKRCYYFKEYKDDCQKYFEKNDFCEFIKINE